MNKAGLIVAALSLPIMLSACSENPSNTVEQQDSQLTADPNLPNGVLNKQSLIRFAMTVSEYQPKDDFSPKEFDDSKLVGRRIQFEQRYFAGISDELPSIYSYDVDKQELTLSVTPPVGLAFIETDLGSEKKSNAFGAEVDVKLTSTNVFFLGYLPATLYAERQTERLPDIGVFKVEQNDTYGSGTATYSYGRVSKTISIKPDAARKLTDGLRLVVDATATRGKSGQSVECDTDYKTATIDSPTQGATTRCAIIVKFDKAAIFAADGKLLAEWK